MRVIEISVDGQKVFGHAENEVAQYDLEEFTTPPVLRKVLWLMKPTEIMSFTTTRREKVVGFFPDNDNKVFDEVVLGAFKKEVKFVIQFVQIDQKEFIHRLSVADKLERMIFLKEVAGKFFKKGVSKKAIKLYSKITAIFKSKDARNNYKKEDAESEEYKEIMKKLENLNKICLTNLAVVELKQKHYREAIAHCDDAIKADRKDAKPLFLKARCLFEMQEYKKAIEFFKKVH